MAVGEGLGKPSLLPVRSVVFSIGMLNEKENVFIQSEPWSRILISVTQSR